MFNRLNLSSPVMVLAEYSRSLLYYRNIEVEGRLYVSYNKDKYISLVAKLVDVSYPIWLSSLPLLIVLFLHCISKAEILKREATPAMRLLNDLLNMHDGFDDEGWLKSCKKCMVDTFPREDPFTILAPAGFDIDKVKSKLHIMYLFIP